MTRHPVPRLAVLFLAIAFALFALAACGGDDDSEAPSDGENGFGGDEPDWGPPDADDAWPDEAGEPADPGEELSWLTARAWPRRGFYDESGRQVLLRGVNFNHLGDYWQVDPSLPTVSDLGSGDWDDAAAMGHNAIRLVTSWSAWEPERDAFDPDYLARVKDAVAEANARDMWVVIDMHQDAWSKFVFTPRDEVCPAGTHHQKGWDGAPLWATITDGQPTCTPGRREESPAVIRAWDHFYADTGGIMGELAELWGFIASEFAHDPGVAGYDLINEPGDASDVATTMHGITTFYHAAVRAIRDAEKRAGSPGHIVFFEPAVTGTWPTFDLQIDNAAFAAHNYVESIGPSVPGLLEVSFAAYDLLGWIYGTPLWIGEYNKFSDPDSNEEWTARFAVQEDRHLYAGGAWWQWEQECGDPHNAQHPPSPEWLEQQVTRCGNARFTPSTCLSRAYPRAAPGYLTSLSAEPCGDDEPLVLSGVTGTRGVADVWYPSQLDFAPHVEGDGIVSINTRRASGGWRIAVEVEGIYSIAVAPVKEKEPASAKGDR